jgi:drug/metabolite transporter (DMT)-like permease
MYIGFLLIVLIAILLGRWAQKKKRMSGIGWAFLGLVVLSMGHTFLGFFMDPFRHQVDRFTLTFLALMVCMAGGWLIGLINDSLLKKRRVKHRANPG